MVSNKTIGQLCCNQMFQIATSVLTYRTYVEGCLLLCVLTWKVLTNVSVILDTRRRMAVVKVC